MNNPLQQRKTVTVLGQQGFTLLEMILVVFIMGTLATISMSFIESEDSQWRYDESLRKMAIVRDAVLKVRDYKSQQLMSGFVFDNGKLPDNSNTFEELLKGTNLQSFEEKEPYFFYDSGNSAVKLADITNGQDTELTLFKGYRSGGTFTSSLDSNNTLLDGWGNNFEITLEDNNTVYSINLDSNNRLAPYNKEPKITVNKHNWSTSVAELNTQKIYIDNQTSAITNNLFIALFVYKNDSAPNAGEWEVFQSESKEIPIGITEHTFSKKLVDGDEQAISDTDRIPAGTHLLALIDKSKLSSTPTAGNISYPEDNPVYQKFTLFPGSSLPDLTLTIK